MWVEDLEAALDKGEQIRSRVKTEFEIRTQETRIEVMTWNNGISNRLTSTLAMAVR